MKLWSVGVDFRSASMDVRSQAAGAKESLIQWLKAHTSEFVWISTCNRTEVFVVAESAPDRFMNAWLEAAQFEAPSKENFMVYTDAESLTHLFRVISSLESMVVGETQISGQVKRAYEDGINSGTVGPYLHRIFQKGFKVAKKIRSQTEVGRLAVSIPSIGVKLAEKVLGDLTQVNVGVLGLGEIGRVAAEHFSSVRPRGLFLFNRTRATADSFVSQAGEDCAIKICESPDEVSDRVSILVNTIDVKTLSDAAISKWKERDEPSLILDLAVPAQIPFYEEPNHYVYRIDDLRAIAEENGRLRKQELEKAEELIRIDVGGLLKSFETVNLGQMLGQIQARTDELCRRELDVLRPRLSHLSEEDWKEIEKLAMRLGAKVLQDPMVGLRSSLQDTEEKENLVQFFRNIFRL